MNNRFFLMYAAILLITTPCRSNNDSEFYRNFETLDATRSLLFRNVFDEEIINDKEKPFVAISLGSNCQPGLKTREYNVKTYAFPFDWCLTPFPALYNFIQNDFVHYFKKDHLVPSLKLYFTDSMTDFFKRMSYVGVSEYMSWVLDKESGMVYNHDFPNNKISTIQAQHNQHYQKYMRRIDRFYEAINSKKYIYFIRYDDVTKNQACQLHQILKEKFPQTNFTLIAIGRDKEEFETDWNIQGLKNYYVGNEFFSWKALCNGIINGVLP